MSERTYQPHLLADLLEQQQARLIARAVDDATADLQAECARLAGERDAALAQAQRYEDAIVWNTTCLSCATLTSANYAQYAEVEQAKADRDAARAALANQIEWLRADAKDQGCDAGNWNGGSADNCEHCCLNKQADILSAALDAAPDARGACSAALETES